MAAVWEEEAFRHYVAYGVDLIRTASILLRTTPSVAYRACMLLQRFERVTQQNESSIKEVARRCEEGVSTTDGSEDAKATLPLIPRSFEYVYPAEAAPDGSHVFPSGIRRLGDLFAPLDARVFATVSGITQAAGVPAPSADLNGVGSDDLLYLAAACLLIATKMEDMSVRMRQIVNVFMRMNSRRRNEAVIELLTPPPDRYDDFKQCVVDAEESVLHTLGFHTVVEYPAKFILVFLECLLKPVDPVDPVSQEACKLRMIWLARATTWINDSVRCAALCFHDSALLAVCALACTCTVEISAELPTGWVTAFGVTQKDVDEVLATYRQQIFQAAGTAAEHLTFQRALHPGLNYEKEKASWNGARLLSSDDDDEVAAKSTGPAANGAAGAIDAAEALRLVQGTSSSTLVSHETPESSSDRRKEKEHRKHHSSKSHHKSSSKVENVAAEFEFEDFSDALARMKREEKERSRKERHEHRKRSRSSRKDKKDKHDKKEKKHKDKKEKKHKRSKRSRSSRDSSEDTSTSKPADSKP